MSSVAFGRSPDLTHQKRNVGNKFVLIVVIVVIIEFRMCESNMYISPRISQPEGGWIKSSRGVTFRFSWRTFWRSFDELERSFMMPMLVWNAGCSGCNHLQNVVQRSDQHFPAVSKILADFHGLCGAAASILTIVIRQSSFARWSWKIKRGIQQKYRWWKNSSGARYLPQCERHSHGGI